MPAGKSRLSCLLKDRAQFPYQLLWHSFSGVRCPMFDLQQVVLQLSRQHLRLAHRKPFGARQTQGSDPPQGRPAWRDRTRMLQLWQQECIHAWVHPGEE